MSHDQLIILGQIEKELEAAEVLLSFLSTPDLRTAIHLKRAAQLLNALGAQQGWIPTEQEQWYMLTFFSVKELERNRSCIEQLASISYDCEFEAPDRCPAEKDLCRLHAQMQRLCKTLQRKALGVGTWKHTLLKPGNILAVGALLLLTYILIGIREESYNPLMWFDSGFNGLRIESAEQDWGNFAVGRSVAGNPLKVGGKTYRRGYGTHANSTIRISFDRNAQFLSGTCGLDDETDNRGSIVCSIWINDKELYRSPLITGSIRSASFKVPIEGAQEAKLVISDGGDGGSYDHSDWVDLKLQ